MTEEEKYQEIVNSRKASEEKKPEEAKPQETNPSGVKTDPPAEKKPETEKQPEEKKPDEGGKNPEDGKGAKPAKPSKDEQQEHAFAAMRMKFKKENDELRKEIEALKKAQADSAPKPKAKTVEDFKSREEYEQYVREAIAEDVRKKVLEEVETSRAVQDEKDKFAAQLRGDLERTFGKDVSDKVLSDLSNPESEMAEIVTDERAKPIVEAVIKSKRRADLLALMQAKPQIFQSMLDLPPMKMAYRVFQLEDQIEARYSAFAAKKEEEEKKKAAAESLPTPGAFGRNGNGNDGIQGLSTQQRVNRYKEEILKQRTKH